MKKQVSEFLKNLRVGDRVIIVEGDYNFINEDNEVTNSKEIYSPFVGEIATVVEIDEKWDYPIQVEFKDEDIQELSEQQDFDLWHESQIEWY